MSGIKLLVLISVSLLCVSCTTSGGVFFNRPVIEDVPGGFKTLAMTADRRIAGLKSDKSDLENYIGLKACAEALPAVAIENDISSKVTAALKDISGNEASAAIKEKLDQAITKEQYFGLLKLMVFATLIEADEEAGKIFSMQVFKEWFRDGGRINLNPSTPYSSSSSLRPCQ